ncbi:MAG: DUF2802 domain-containing protein [Betaproteobacteria bacterium]|jgi:hypothetical protein|nr:DUF2802 domain-containing protein [Betaproteobacteria bacterium]
MRQLVSGLIVLLLVYGGWQFLLALRTGFRRQTVLVAAKKPTARNFNDGFFNYEPISAKEPKPNITVAVYSHEQTDISPTEKEREVPINAAPLDSFAIELELQRLRLEINTLRETVETQQKEIESLRANEEHPPAARIETATPLTTQEPDMSPEYDEALALARRGIMADVIASRCGITRAEADLVASLASRGRQRGAT